MRYFEVQEPYYALIKAKNKEDAMVKYIEIIADDDGTLKDDIKEVSHDYALLKFSRTLLEDKTLPSIEETLREFNLEDNEILVIDGSLI